MKKALLVLALVLIVLLICGCSAITSDADDGDGTDISVSDDNSGVLDELTGSRSDTVSILLLITVLAVLPSILIMLTCFPRIIIVLSLIRNGLGLQNMPPNQVLIGLALFLTFFVMSPVIGEIKEEAYQPYIDERIEEEEAIDLAMGPVREFMLEQTYEKDLAYFVSISGNEEIEDVDDIENTVLIPAFMTSEIKRGFQNRLLFIPAVCGVGHGCGKRTPCLWE